MLNLKNSLGTKKSKMMEQPPPRWQPPTANQREDKGKTAIIPPPPQDGSLHRHCLADKRKKMLDKHSWEGLQIFKRAYKAFPVADRKCQHVWGYCHYPSLPPATHGTPLVLVLMHQVPSLMGAGKKTDSPYQNAVLGPGGLALDRLWLCTVWVLEISLWNTFWLWNAVSWVATVATTNQQAGDPPLLLSQLSQQE